MKSEKGNEEKDVYYKKRCGAPQSLQKRFTPDDMELGGCGTNPIILKKKTTNILESSPKDWHYYNT